MARKVRPGARVRAVIEEGDFDVIEAGVYVGDVKAKDEEDGYWIVVLERNQASVETVCLHEADLEVL